MNLKRYTKQAAVLILSSTLVCGGGLLHVAIAQQPGHQTSPMELFDFNSFNNAVRDGKIKKAEALKQIQTLLPLVKQYYYAHGGKDYKPSEWVFPLAGYNAKALGGKNGDGYIASGYDYFDGNKHGGHPAHDIFVNDKDQDGIEDRTKKPVQVLAMTEGIIIALENNWATTSGQRGGNYIWVYVPSQNGLCYYAHNSKVFVHVRDIVKPGDVIAEVGRTGLNAYKKRSPTHLHFMQMKIDQNGYPKPVNGYTDLVRISK